MGRKKLVRKAEPPSKRGIAWPRWTGFRGKTVWDWLPIGGALLVPLVVAIGTMWITWQLGENENQRAEAERELAEKRAQDEALQAYLDQMGTLLLERHLRSSTKDNATEDSQEARTLARARTLTVLSRLDPSRKTAVMQFLVEADLVQRVDGRDPIISLRGADLSGADLRDADLSGADLRDADLSGASPRFADLSGARLRFADLSSANLRGAELRDAGLGGADLSGADLEGANLSGASLRSADLSGASLRYAYLSEPNLSSDANLSDANLRGANLRYALGITNEGLEQQAASLEGAIMPNGQKYEDWRKSKGRE